MGYIKDDLSFLASATKTLALPLADTENNRMKFRGKS